MAHIHGCLRLKNDQGIDQLAQTVLQDRISKVTLKMIKIIDDTHSNETLSDEFFTVDQIIQIKQSDFLQELSEDEIVTHIENIEKGKKAHKTVIAFYDW